VVDITVTPLGTVIDPVVVSANDARFAEATVAVVRQWRFQPARKQGTPVEVCLRVPFEMAGK